MQIKEITLLTSAEYNQTKHLISDLECTWWLKDEGEYENPNCVSFISAEVTDVCSRESERYVRPALRLMTDVPHEIGTKVTLFAYAWTVLDYTNNIALLLCDNVVTLRPFDKKDQHWESSDIKKWLEAWLAKRQKTTEHQLHKRYRKMNEIGMAYNANPFWNAWLAPMLLLLSLIAATCYCAWTISAEFLPPTWLNTAMFYVCTTMCVMFVLTGLFVLSTPHKDTGFRHLLNAAICAFMVAFFYQSATLFGITAMVGCTSIASLNHNYLRRIKYYS